MDTGEALLRAVLADKANDLPRLVYADWLEENGDADRAEFIRIQCELARPEHKICVVEVGGRGCICRTCLLKTRERDLFDVHGFKWFGEYGKRAAFLDRESVLSANPMYGDLARQIVRRGFIAEVRCTMAGWYGDIAPVEVTSIHQPQIGVFRPGVGPQIVRRHPVERVALTNAEPFHGTVGHVWLRGSSTGPLDFSPANVVPDGVFDQIDAEEREEDYSGRYKSFATRELANKALSDAGIKWAESQIT